MECFACLESKMNAPKLRAPASFAKQTAQDKILNQPEEDPPNGGLSFCIRCIRKSLPERQRIIDLTKGGLACFHAGKSKMKSCRSVKELIKMLDKGIPAMLVVYGSKTPWWTAGIWGYSGGDTLTLNVRGIRHGEMEQDNLLLLADIPAHQEASHHPAVPLSGGERRGN